ncbi:hypothetical protein [Chthonomonas calidirosea]|uniref:Uncharacterized protein n=1 Tax=Chthonomonas calidirosea (strain DSM 23976 / ICMP 18418 / T49) TaxID=1303518 RepID=S0EXR5_CHTCT|nr:hypothetical protein [Chthonomonas calidirosea]CCW36691.1 hypothetical protein CCALI_02906 [Chthonomonas calidirosea T49]CEK15474.1 hypothetical protein CP488_01182 [Chthonomonas calidirosea]CEK16576.1 hypothetical protein CTKA_01182 [Chthonomonas calidirosea]
MSVQPYTQGGFFWTNPSDTKPLKADAMAREQALGQQLEQQLSARIAQIRRALFSASPTSGDAGDATAYSLTAASESPTRLDIEA